jgi:hypothetical protein
MTQQRSAATAIVASELADVLRAESDVVECLKIAFRRVQNHWMFHDRDDQFAAAVAAVGLRFGIQSPEFEQLRRASEAQRRGVATIQALQAGVAVDLAAMVEDLKDEPPVIPLNKLWWEAVEAAEVASQT